MCGILVYLKSWKNKFNIKVLLKWIVKFYFFYIKLAWIKIKDKMFMGKYNIHLVWKKI